MKTITMILAGAALALSGATAVSAETAAERGEAKLARMLEGRVAGEPERCISAVRSNKVETIDHVGLVYDAGETIYVARATDPDRLRRTDALVLRRLSSGLLCSDDVRFTIDRHQGNITGSVFLTDFVPYRRG
jgi:hypothetical protein